jgi:hypothetical protein
LSQAHFGPIFGGGPRIYAVTETSLARLLIEEVPQKTAKVDKKIGVVATRMLLAIFSVPSLLSNLVDFAIIANGEGDGKVRIQLDFLRLPKEIIPELEKLMSVDYFKDHKLLRYVKNGQARTGLEIELTPKDIPGDKFDYAY